MWAYKLALEKLWEQGNKFITFEMQMCIFK
jgi:hypothetical protein